MELGCWCQAQCFPGDQLIASSQPYLCPSGLRKLSVGGSLAIPQLVGFSSDVGLYIFSIK